MINIFIKINLYMIANQYVLWFTSNQQTQEKGPEPLGGNMNSAFRACFFKRKLQLLVASCTVLATLIAVKLGKILEHIRIFQPEWIE